MKCADGMPRRASTVRERVKDLPGARGSQIVLLDETWRPMSGESDDVVCGESGCFVWSGSLCHTVRQLSLNDQASHDIECCMLAAGEYKFAVLCTSLDEDEKQHIERCWSSHPAVVTVV